MNAPVPVSQQDAKPATPERMEVRVRGMTLEAPGVMSLELTRPDGSALPPFDPGAHIDLILPGGVIRQYSLWGDPADTSRYHVGIRAVGGGLSSNFVHRKLRPGELIWISAPRNNFPLVEAPRYIFVAGGIGITPLIPMMRAATAARKSWTLLYCNKSDADAPFLKHIHGFGGEIHLHSSQAGTRLDVVKTLGQPQKDTMVYCCGPEGLMAAVEEATSQWPQGSVHFEWFAPRSRPGDEVAGSFQIVCEKSGLTLTVEPDKSVLQTLNDAGIDVPCSCQQGVCGTCEVRVLSGEVDHRDSILSATERAANETMMTCISRARSPRLILEI
jgi:ferredoxin-NADP reductase